MPLAIAGQLNNILRAVHDNKSVILPLLDLSSAFDTVGPFDTVI